MRLALALVLAAAAVVCGAAADVASAASDKGVLSMSPARRALTARPPVHLTPTRVSNSTKLTMDITVFPTLLVQELDGSFGFTESAQDLNAAKLQFAASPTRFVLRPDEEKDLALTWQTMPRQARAGYYGLVVQGVPKQKGQGVGSVLRLLGINFFKLPGRWTVDGRLTGLRGEQAGPQVLRFFPRVRNTGQIHEQPRNGHCKVVEGGAAGAVRIKNLKYGQGVVLPGFEREYPIVIKKPNVLPAGSYVMRCAQRFGKRMTTKDLPFKLSGPNTLPTAALRLQSVAASGEIGGAARVRPVVRNAGSKASAALLKVRVDRIPVGRRPVLVARGRFPQGSIDPGQTRKPELSLGKLVAGNYRVTVVLAAGGVDLAEKTADFAAKPKLGLFDRLKDWWWLLLVVLAVGLVLWLLWRQRKRQRELEEELERTRLAQADAAAAPATAPAGPAAATAPASPAPSTPAPPLASGDGRISINTGTVEELMQLPGVGRRAAERIIAHREANGAFGSLEDLRAVEGWHAERIRRISDDATV